MPMPVSRVGCEGRDGAAPLGAPQGAPGEASCPPPHSNTVVESARENGIDCLVDYIRVRFGVPDGDNPSAPWLPLPDVLALFGSDGWAPMERARYGYRSGWKRGAVEVYADGHSSSMGVLVQASGEGCRQLEADLGLTDWGEFLGRLLDGGGRFARLDVALDERAGFLDMGVMWEAVKHRHLTSRFKSAARWQNVELSGEGGETDGGHTIYLGKRVSGACFRIYDKAAEQGEVGHWVRVEGEFHDERAQVLAQLIRAAGLEAFPEVVKSYVDFKAPGDGEQRCRWETALWWEAFLGQVGRLRLAVKPKQRTLETARAWVEKSVAPTLAALVKAEGGLKWLLRVMGDGSSRITEDQRSVLGGMFGEQAVEVGTRKLRVHWEFGGKEGWDVAWV